MIHFNDQTFYLATKNSSYIMKLSPDGVLIHCYYGKRIKQQNMEHYNLYIPYDYTVPYVLDNEITTPDALPQECPGFGRGDYRSPAVVIESREGRRVNDFRYESHSVCQGAPALDGLPHLDTATDSAETLEVVLRDIITGAAVHLFYVVFEDIDIVARHTVVENVTENPVTLCRAASASLDFESDNFEMVSLYGRWANECTPERYSLHHGQSVIASNRGATGHHANPFAALVKKNTGEDHGEVYGLAMIYSGNFEIGGEINQFGGTRFYAGINKENFSWELSPGEKFISPQAVLTYSSEGFGGMSHNFHRACRRHLGVCARRKKHPVVLNLWEAFYFNVTEQKVFETINDVQNLGIDMLVVDDGWFGKRQSEKSSLGDWFVNTEKFTGGLGDIIRLCQSHDLKFGLWFEPEMISPDSELYQKHPDWCIHIPGVEPVKSRYELVLDLSRDEVVESVYNSISSILKQNDISYVKWDMNRNITDNGSISLPAQRQGEHAHRYILGVYRLMERFRRNFPDIFFEGSAGGGGRIDMGMLYYMSQIWTSDNSDAIGRLKIQYGASMVYPPETISSHVSECPNHQTGRITPFKTRGDVAQLFSFGYELNPKTLSETDKEQLAAQISKHRELEKWMSDARFYRLIDPVNGEDCAWQVVSNDKKHSAVLYIVQLTKPKRPGRYLRLKGLDESKTYTVRPGNLTLSGDFLMHAGIPVRKQYNDFESTLFEIFEAL